MDTSINNNYAATQPSMESAAITSKSGNNTFNGRTSDVPIASSGDHLETNGKPFKNYNNLKVSQFCLFNIIIFKVSLLYHLTS